LGDYLAMREALKQRLTVIASDTRQEAILAKVMAERQGGIGTAALPAGAVPAVDDISAILAEMDDLPAHPGPVQPQLAQSTVPVTPPPAHPANPGAPTTPKAPVVGVLSLFPNLSERLQHRREQKPGSAPASKTAPFTRTP
jgi:hypothetical protein